MASKTTKKKLDAISEGSLVKKVREKRMNEDMNWMSNIGESPLRTYEMLRNKFLNIQ